MKMKELKELKSKEKKELVKLVNSKKLEVRQITSKIYAGREKNLKTAHNLRREIAQIMTLINQVKEERK